MDKNMVDFYVWCIKNIDGFTIDDVPEQRRAEVEAQLLEGGDI